MAEPESFFKRLTRIFRSGPAVQRRVKGKDTRSYYGTQMMQGNYGYRASAPFGFGRENSPFSILGSYGILDRMARYAEFCFHPDTLVYTNKGVYTIKELAEKYKSDEIFHVWSYDHKKKTVVLATAHHPRVTKEGKKQKIIKITLDDGASIKTTLDHKFMLRDGSYLEAKDLEENMALMPFNMRKYTGGYHQIYLLNKEENKFGWGKEHVMVAEHFANRKLSENEVIHHEDFNPENNCIDNLAIMDSKKHKRYHANLNNRNKFNKKNKSHSVWMKKNNPTKRIDITFDSIFDTAVAVDFSLKKTMGLLDADQNVIKRRLREVGFKNWVEFRNFKGELQKIRCASRILEETTKPLNVKTLKEVATEAKTIYEASSILGCTENTIRRFLKRNDLGSWSQLKGNSFDPGIQSKNSAFDNSITYQDICNAYVPGMTRKELAVAAGTTINKIVTRLERESFSSYLDWCKVYKNHKIKSIEILEEESVVYNLTVDGHHNLAVGDYNTSKSCKERPYSMVYVRQSEMEYTPEIATALDIYADETVGGDDRGRCFHIYSDNSEIKGVLDDLFYDVLNVEFNLKPWVRNLVKYGDFFLFNEVHPDLGIINVIPIPVNEIEREEGFDMEDPYAIRYKWLTRGSKYLENWQVTHLRILGNDLFLPYGTSILEPARRTWRQLSMLEDSMLVYRVVRSPERRVFFIDVGNIEPNDVPNYMDAAKATLRSRDIVDRSTGREDHRLNTMAMTDDYFIPVRGAQSSTRIETLPGGTNATATEDVEYIQRKLFAGLKVPKPYLNFDENLSAKASLAQMDVRFSRTIQGLQKVLIAELNKLAMIHLFSMNFDGADLVNFELKLSNPSSVALQQKMELWSVKFDIGGSAKETKLVDERWVQKYILELTDPEIAEIEKGLRRDRYREMEIEALEPEELDETQPDKTTDLFDPTNYDMVGGDVPKVPPTEEDDSFSPVSVTVDRVNGKETAGLTDEEAFVLDLEKAASEEEQSAGGAIKRPPIEATQPTPHLNRSKKNRKRRVGVGRGRENMAMPDMAAMLSPKNKYNKDIHGQRTEGVEYEEPNLMSLIDNEEYRNLIEIEPMLGREMRSKLQRLESALGIKRNENTNNLLTEELEEFEIEIEGLEDEFDIIEEATENKNLDETETIKEKTLVEVLNDES